MLVHFSRDILWNYSLVLGIQMNNWSSIVCLSTTIICYASYGWLLFVLQHMARRISRDGYFFSQFDMLHIHIVHISGLILVWSKYFQETWDQLSCVGLWYGCPAAVLTVKRGSVKRGAAAFKSIRKTLQWSSTSEAATRSRKPPHPILSCYSFKTWVTKHI